MKMLKTNKAQTIKHASEIYLAMNGYREAQKKVTIAEAENHIHADSFEEFLNVNRIAVYESELRNANI